MKIFLGFCLALCLVVQPTFADEEGFDLESIVNFENVSSAVSKLGVRPGFLYFPDLREGKIASTTSATLMAFTYKDVEYASLDAGYFVPEGVFGALSVRLEPVLGAIPGLKLTTKVLDLIPGDPDVRASLGYGHQFSTQEEGYGVGGSVRFKL